MFASNIFLEIFFRHNLKMKWKFLYIFFFAMKKSVENWMENVINNSVSVKINCIF